MPYRDVRCGRLRPVVSTPPRVFVQAVLAIRDGRLWGSRRKRGMNGPAPEMEAGKTLKMMFTRDFFLSF